MNKPVCCKLTNGVFWCPDKDLSPELIMLFKVGIIETNKLRRLEYLKKEIYQEYWLMILTGIHSYKGEKGAIATWAKQVFRSAISIVMVRQHQEGFKFRGKPFIPEGSTYKDRPSPKGKSCDHHYLDHVLPTNTPRSVRLQYKRSLV